LSLRRRVSNAAITLAAAFFVSLTTTRAAQKLPLSDTTRIVDTIKALFTAISSDDLAKFDSLVFYICTKAGNDLHLIPSSPSSKSERAADKHYGSSVTQTDVHVSGNTAWIAYVNHGTVTDASGTIHRKWLESAFLKREAGRWKIVFFHSDRVPPPPQNHL
jgi:hypothetical protein